MLIAGDPAVLLRFSPLNAFPTWLGVTRSGEVKVLLRSNDDFPSLNGLTF